MKKKHKIYLSLTGVLGGLGTIITPIITTITTTQNDKAEIKELKEQVKDLQKTNQKIANGEWPTWIKDLKPKVDLLLKKVYEIVGFVKGGKSGR